MPYVNLDFWIINNIAVFTSLESIWNLSKEEHLHLLREYSSKRRVVLVCLLGCTLPRGSLIDFSTSNFVLGPDDSTSNSTYWCWNLWLLTLSFFFFKHMYCCKGWRTRNEVVLHWWHREISWRRLPWDHW